MGSRVQAVVYLGWILLSVIPGIEGVSELAMVLMLPLTGSNCELATLHWKAALQGLSLEALPGNATWKLVLVDSATASPFDGWNELDKFLDSEFGSVPRIFRRTMMDQGGRLRGIGMAIGTATGNCCPPVFFTQIMLQ
eukprot:1182346-Prorocentrum_minimum.AAC.4